MIPQNMKKYLVYPFSAAFAQAAGENDEYLKSKRINQSCRRTIDESIGKNWDGTRLAENSAKAVLNQFLPERVAYVLADEVQQNMKGNRFSGENRDWARNFPMFVCRDCRPLGGFNCTSPQIDAFISQLRQELEQQDIHLEKLWDVKSVPVYQGTLDDAEARDELPQYWLSRDANAACRDAADLAIKACNVSDYLSIDGAKSVLKLYGPERLSYVLAATVQRFYNDGRFSYSNKQWADTIPVFEDWRNSACICGSHPAVLDIFINQAREEIQKSEMSVEVTSAPEQKPEPPKKESVRARLARKSSKQEKPAAPYPQKEVTL